jgi:hypothetical protein
MDIKFGTYFFAKLLNVDNDVDASPVAATYPAHSPLLQSLHDLYLLTTYYLFHLGPKKHTASIFSDEEQTKHEKAEAVGKLPSGYTSPKRRALQTARRYNPECRTVHSHCFENIKIKL